MSAFDDFMAGALGEHQAIVGTTPFFWEGRKLDGDFSKLDVSYDVEEGGKKLRVSATLFASRPQWTGAVPKKGQPVKVGGDTFGDTYEIAHAEGDALGFMLYLGADIRRQA